jgi:hypothetical protein
MLPNGSTTKNKAIIALARLIKKSSIVAFLKSKKKLTRKLCYTHYINQTFEQKPAGFQHAKGAKISHY